MPAPPCRSRRSPLRRRSRHSACSLTADRPARQPGQRRTRHAILSTARHQSPPRRHIPAAVRRHVSQRDGGALLLSRSAHRAPLHLFPSAADRPPAAGRPGGWPGPVQLTSALLCPSQLAPRPRVGSAAGAPDVAPPPRCCRVARLRWPTARRWPGGRRDTLRSAARRAWIFAAASSNPGRSLVMRSCKALSWSAVNEFLPLPASYPTGSDGPGGMVLRAPCGVAYAP